MQANFDKALTHVLKYEGGYSDHPEDPGGATNFGITIGVLREHRGAPVTKQDVRLLTLAEAARIYRARYWNAASCDQLPAGIDLLRAGRGIEAVASACEAVLSEVRVDNAVLPQHRNIPPSEWRRIRMANQRVWQGVVCDPTQGATACHKHNENPCWARQRIPTALLGEYLFFR